VSGLEFIVDSREKWKLVWASKLRKLGCDVRIEALEAGDFATKHTVFERKTVADFVQSMRGNYGRVGGRLFDQAHKLIRFAQRTDRIPFLVIIGDFGEYKEAVKQYGNLNVNAVFGAIASVIVRYDINVIWNLRGEDEAIFVMYKIAEKVAEGKLNVPHRQSIRKVHTDPKVIRVANVLGVSPKLAARLVQKFGGLRRILLASDQELMTVKGVGPVVLSRIKALIGE